MESMLAPLRPLFDRERSAGRAMALAINLQTAGSTYSKSGALLLIATDGEFAGLLSGGCLEGDLLERSRQVITSGETCRVQYDMRGPDDLVWGMGAGCEGAMDIFMLRVSAANDWQPVAMLSDGWRTGNFSAAGVVIESEVPATPAGTVIRIAPGVLPVNHATWVGGYERMRVYGLAPSPPPRLLLLGAGPDALPVFQFAAALGWRVTLYDHRAVYGAPERFPGAEHVIHDRPENLAAAIQSRSLSLDDFTGVVVMSHHLDSDAAYLTAVAASGIPYVGLLGPAPRRERLRSMVGTAFGAMSGRLRSPVGLHLGGRTPEAIALSIAAEFQAFLHGLQGGRFNGE
jgi:xanthine/CO dehydrogenase XdhC/CoxF family maturation factor